MIKRNNPRRPGHYADYSTSIFLITLLLLFRAPVARARDIIVGAAAPSNPDGTAAHPFPSIQPALDLAQPGDTVIVRKGTYREQILMKHGGTADKPITLRADPVGSVTVDGADAITGFQEDSTHETTDGSQVWLDRAYHALYFPMGNDYNLRTDWLKEGETGKQQVELLSRDDMVWLDGRFLDQVDSPGQLRFGTFWVDRKKGGLYVPIIAGDRPEDHLIEATARGTLFDCGPQASFVHLRGFHFTRGGFNGKAVVKIGNFNSQGWVAEDNIADWGNFSGFQFYGNHNQILRNIAAHNGCEGMQGIIHDTLLDGNWSISNNWKGIRDTYESGGGKFTESDHVVVRNHLAAWNVGPGLWFDITNTNITVENSQFHDNKYAGLFMEIGPGPTIFRENRCWANQGGGIVIGESNNVLIENNILANNWYGIDLRNLQGRHGRFGSDSPGSAESDWQTSDVTIRNNIFVKNIFAAIGNTCYYLDPQAERISSDHNTFWASHLYRWQKPDPKGPYAGMPTPPQVKTTFDDGWIIDNIWAKPQFGGFDEHSVWKDPGFTNADMYQFPAPQPVNAGE